MKRHDLIYLRKNGYRFAIQNAYSPLSTDIEMVAEAIQGEKSVPGIVCTQWKPHKGILDVGYVTNYYKAGNRIRFATKIHTADIRAVVTPKEVFFMEETWPKRFKKCLEKLRVITEACNCSLGIFGSVAMEIVTGRVYTRKTSDVDLVLYVNKESDIETFYRNTVYLQKRYDVKFDIEIEIPKCGNAKLAELILDSTTVLCKGMYGPAVYRKETFEKLF